LSTIAKLSAPKSKKRVFASSVLGEMRSEDYKLGAKKIFWNATKTLSGASSPGGFRKSKTELAPATFPVFSTLSLQETGSSPKSSLVEISVT
jgi:hypothetical protein